MPAVKALLCPESDDPAQVANVRKEILAPLEVMKLRSACSDCGTYKLELHTDKMKHGRHGG